MTKYSLARPWIQVKCVPFLCHILKHLELDMRFDSPFSSCYGFSWILIVLVNARPDSIFRLFQLLGPLWQCILSLKNMILKYREIEFILQSWSSLFCKTNGNWFSQPIRIPSHAIACNHANACYSQTWTSPSLFFKREIRLMLDAQLWHKAVWLHLDPNNDHFLFYFASTICSVCFISEWWPLLYKLGGPLVSKRFLFQSL